MACHFNENVYTTVFTPREYQVELLDTAKEKNTIVCLGNNNAKIFVAVKLLQELAAEVRKLGGKRSIFLLDAQNVRIMCSHVRNLTDLTVGQYDNLEDVAQYTEETWKSEMEMHQVLVMTSEICQLCVQNRYLTLDNMNLLIIDDCRLALKQNSLRELLQDYSSLPELRRPRILGLTTTVLSRSFNPARLEAEFEYMENILNCTVDTSSDIVTVLRYCSKPTEKLMVCANVEPCSLSQKLALCITNIKSFLDDHRYDPFEIYADDFQDELQDVPDPKIEPLTIIDEFLDILYTMGPWCAERAAFALLLKIEHLKVKTPYERHYLLLCMVSTVLVKIRAICATEFEKFTDRECIYAFSTPRVLRLLQVLKTFKPDTPKTLTVTPLPACIAVSSGDTTQTSTADVISADCDNSENSQNNHRNNSTEPYSNVEFEPNGEDGSLRKINNIVSNDPCSNVIELISNIMKFNSQEAELTANDAFESDSISIEQCKSNVKLNSNNSSEPNSNGDELFSKIAELNNKIAERSNNNYPSNSIELTDLSNDVDQACNNVTESSNSAVESLCQIIAEPSKCVLFETSTSIDEPSKIIDELGNNVADSNKADQNNLVGESCNNVIFESNSNVAKLSNSGITTERNCNIVAEQSSSIANNSKKNSIISMSNKPIHSNIRIIVSDYDKNETETNGNDIAETCSSNIIDELIDEPIENVDIQIIVTEPDAPHIHADITDSDCHVIHETNSNDNYDRDSYENDSSSNIVSNSVVPFNHVDDAEKCRDSAPSDKIVNGPNSVIESCSNVIVLDNNDDRTNSDGKSDSSVCELNNDDEAFNEPNSNDIEPSTNDIESSNNDIESISNAPAIPNANIRPCKGKVRGQRKEPNVRRFNYSSDPDALCALIFVKRRFTAKILFYLINELSHVTTDFEFLSVQYTVEKIADPITDSREAEIEHRKQEDVLKKFRTHECNLLIGTSVLEEGIDVPKCNLVVRFDEPQTYNSYVQCKGRAKMPDAHYVLMSDANNLEVMIKQLAQYIEIEKLLLKKCKNREPTEIEQREADFYNNDIQPYSPSNTDSGAVVSVATAIALVNKYCAKLPSDTFTRLTPLWWMENTIVDCTDMYVCSIRLPINSPLKQTITGVPMPNQVLARRVTALQVCRWLHQIGELDDNLLPVGKESFKAFEEDWNNFPLEECDEMLTKTNLEPRPGTTKRRQYYYKRVADALTDCRPMADVPTYLYLITMTLTCPLPEEQNTRGRKIYPPEDSAQGFGILTLKQIPKICPFPIFTRSGEVRVGLELASTRIIMTTDQLEKIMEFLNYIFTNVLRLQKYLMLFDPNASENSYFIVPTQTSAAGVTDVDWNFLNEIYENRNLTPHIVPENERTDFKFRADMYQDAVVMPWYRNQDQPQYFYVAEICSQLNPKSSFPGTDYSTFEEYYFKKYGIQIQNLDQPLLDVDHTSARLNFLTPRYVNRKGVALPTSSEETKRAKRENLEQKQILVPELCTVHPFPASLWRKAVCLPCILYRINALLLADQIRKQVAEELALGLVELSSDFEWTPLNFGWSLSDVLKKSKETRQEKSVEKTPEHIIKKEDPFILVDDKLKIVEITDDEITETTEDDERNTLEIGYWSNEMASSETKTGLKALAEELPNNITMCSTWENDKLGLVRYGSPTSWMQSPCFDDYDSDDSCDSDLSDPESSETSNKSGKMRIEYKRDNVAEAIDSESSFVKRQLMLLPADYYEFDECMDEEMEQIVNVHNLKLSIAVQENEKYIISGDIILLAETEFKLNKKTESSKPTDEPYETLNKPSLKLPDVNIYPAIQLSHIENEESEKCVVETNDELDPEFEKINFKFSFDFQPDLRNHPGPSPSVILQALTMSNANDGINLERLETIGDSFLKYAITNYLYSTYDNIHEGKLSHLRSKQVSNLNLYRLGRLKVLGESMIATKFDPHDNWLPPCYYVPKELEQALIDARVPASHWNQADMQTVKDMSKEEICEMVREKGEKLGVLANRSDSGENECTSPIDFLNLENLPCFIPYNLITQHSIPDKSVADCVEALIGAYLIECGPRGALLFMAWLGIRVLPKTETIQQEQTRPTGSLPAINTDHGYKQVLYGELTCPRSPLLHHSPNAKFELEKLLNGYSEFERNIQYYFRDRSYLLQALTHASYSPNTVTDCYQRLEFLGDAVLDYLITRHLYEDSRLHSPGALTDLRSALVNNTIFASLAVRHGFHKYFRHLSPGLHEVVNRFVQIQEENGHSISEEYYLIAEDESEEIEDVEVPKALGDVFESVAGAIFLDSGMSLDAVWRVYYRMMRNEIEQFSTSVPKSPIRELLELEPETAKFGKPEKLADGRRVRVTVEVFGKGIFKGIGRNYRIAKCTAAKCALKQLKTRGLLVRKNINVV